MSHIPKQSVQMHNRSSSKHTLFQRDLDRLSEWCRSNKFDLNAGKCKSISIRPNMRPIEFVYSINGTALERVDVIKDLGVIMEGKTSFFLLSPNHREW
jgi:hypothetical protein